MSKRPGFAWPFCYDRGLVIGAFRRSRARSRVLSWGKSNIIRRNLALYCVLNRVLCQLQECFIWRLPDDIFCKARRLAAMAPALGVIGERSGAGPRPIRDRRAGLAPRAVAVRRHQISGRLQALRLRQSGCAQGRYRPPDPDRDVRQFQCRGGRRQRLDRGGRPARLRIADDVIAGRSFDRIRRAGRGGQPSRGFLFRHLSPAGPGEMA